MRRKPLLYGLAAFVLLSPFPARYVASRSAVPVEVAQAQPRRIRETVLATGNLIYRDEALLSPEIIAKVQAVLVKEGDRVEAGQPVILLEQENLRQTVAQQQAQVAIEGATTAQQHANVSNMELQLARMKDLSQKGFASKSSYDNAAYGLSAARAQLAGNQLAIGRAQATLKQADFELQRTVIRAPMAGTVVSVSIKPGETAVPSATGIPGSSLVTIARKGTMMVDLNVDENDVGRLAIGSEARITCPTLPDAGITGKLREIALAPRRTGQILAANDATGRTYSVKVDLNGYEAPALREGMSCRAKIYTSDPPATVSVPVQAVLNEHSSDDDGINLPGEHREKAQKYVFVLTGDRVAKRQVTTGIADDEYQQILSGVGARERIVTGPYRLLKSLVDGAKISVASLD